MMGVFGLKADGFPIKKNLRAFCDIALFSSEQILYCDGSVHSLPELLMLTLLYVPYVPSIVF